MLKSSSLLLISFVFLLVVSLGGLGAATEGDTNLTLPTISSASSSVVNVTSDGGGGGGGGGCNVTCRDWGCGCGGGASSYVVDVTSSNLDGFYRKTQVIEIAVKFNTPVFVSPYLHDSTLEYPALELQFNNKTKYIYYSNGTGTDTLIFKLTVGDGDETSDLDYTSITSLVYNTYNQTKITIRDGLDNPTNLLLPLPGSAGSLGFNKNLQVNGSYRARVINVTADIPNRLYHVGDGIPITVQFSDNITIYYFEVQNCTNASCGWTGYPYDEYPKLNLKFTNGSTKYINVSRERWPDSPFLLTQVSSDTLIFNYTIREGDYSSDLDYADVSSLVYNIRNASFVTIRDVFGVEAAISLPLPGSAGSLGFNKDIVVNGWVPAIPPLNWSSTIIGNYTLKNGPTAYAGVVQYGASSAALLNGNVVVAYTNATGNGSLGYFQIYDSLGNVVKGVTKFDAVVGAWVDDVHIAVLPNGNFVIAYWTTAYQTADSNNVGNFVIFDSNGNLIRDRTVFADYPGRITISPFTNGNFFIGYDDWQQNHGYYGTFNIYNSSGSQVTGPTVFNSRDSRGYSSSTSLDNGNVLLAYSNFGDSYLGKFIIIDPFGSIVKDSTLFNSATTASISTATLKNGNVLIAYVSTTKNYTNYGSYVILDSAGNQIKGPTIFLQKDISGGNNEDLISVGALPNGDAFIAYSDGSNLQYGKFLVLDSAGDLKQDSTIFEPGHTELISVAVFTNSRVFISFMDWDASWLGRFVIFGFDDLTPPVISDNAPAGWQNQSFIFNITAFDSFSGVKYVSYRINGGAWQNGSSVTINSEGNSSVEYYAEDNVGNRNPIHMTYALLDTSKPVISYSGLSPDEFNPATLNLSVYAKVQDSFSGIAEVNARVFNSSNSNLLTSNLNLVNSDIYSGEFVLSGLGDGSYFVEITVRDNVDNTKSETKSFKLNSSSTNLGFIEQYNFNNGSIIPVDWNSTGLGLRINSSENTSAYVYLSSSNEDNRSSNLGIPALGKFFDISAPDLEGKMNEAYISVSYLDAEVAAKGIDESTLRLYYFNSTSNSWIAYEGTDGIAPDGGVNTSGNYVWALTNHFSTWGIFGSLTTHITRSASSGGGDPDGCTTHYICTAWSTCSSEGVSTRTCAKEKPLCYSPSVAPANVSSCTPIKNQQDNSSSDQSALSASAPPLVTSTSSNSITGAVIGFVRGTSGVIVLVFVLVITGAFLVMRATRRNPLKQR